MGYCKNCGKEIDDGTKFCPDCGATLEEQPQVETKPEVPRWEGENGEEKKGLVYAGFALALCSIFTLFFNILLSFALGAVALIIYFTSKNDVSDSSLQKFSKATMYASIAALAIGLIILCVAYGAEANRKAQEQEAIDAIMSGLLTMF